MARYRVYVPDFEADPARRLTRAVFVRDGWNWGAFAFGPLWLLWHRHWALGLVAVFCSLALMGAIGVFPGTEWSRASLQVALGLLWGLEGASLRALALAYSGYNEVALMVGADLESLEQRFFAASVGNSPAAATGLAAGMPPGTSLVAQPAPASASAPWCGLFSDTGKNP